MTEPLLESTTVADCGSMIEPLSAMLVRVLGKDYDRQDCALARALETIGERWTLLIVRDAFFGVRRFNDFQVHLDVPKAVLSARLAGLVREGVMERRPDPDHAGRHLYELTAAGRELWPVLHARVGRQPPVPERPSVQARGVRHRHRRRRRVPEVPRDAGAAGPRDGAPAGPGQAMRRPGGAGAAGATPFARADRPSGQ
jgi:DNA-binding HxlR family transcriptional regulator